MCQLRKFCLFVGCVFYAGVCGADVLDNKINELTKRRDELKLAISQCESKTHKFKIAGITTLVATGFGVYGNIKLAQRLRYGETAGGIGGKSEAIIDPRPQEEKNDASCRVLCEAGDVEPPPNCVC